MKLFYIEKENRNKEKYFFIQEINQSFADKILIPNIINLSTHKIYIKLITSIIINFDAEIEFNLTKMLFRSHMQIFFLNQKAFAYYFLRQKIKHN